jgi:hypothetical protein
MLCGPDYIEWPHFRRAAMCLRDLPNVPSPALVNRTMELVRLIAPIHSLNFLILLSRAHQRLCKDQRDKVYGILALASPELLKHIAADYGQPVGSVYRDVFVAVVKHTKRLEILSYTIHEPQRRTDMPSWVADWSYFPRFPLGHLIAYDMAPVTSGYSCVEADLRQWAPKESTYLPTGEDAEDAYTWTLVQGRVNERYGYFPVWPGFVLSLQERKEAVYREVRDEERLAEDAERLEEVLIKVHDRVFFTTADGHFGLAPAATQQGEHHCYRLM